MSADFSIEAKDPTEQPIKIVVVGDGSVGKTCMLIVLGTLSFPGEYVPTVCDDFEQRIQFPDGKSVQTRLEEKIMIRVKTAWWPEVSRHMPESQKILVGTKSDFREDPPTIEMLRQKNQQFVTQEEAEAMAEEIGAYCYIEISSLKGDGMTELRTTMSQLGDQHRRGEKIQMKRKRKDASRMMNRCVAM